MTAAMSREQLLALPATVDPTTGGRAIGVGRTKAFELIRRGEFPARVLKLGSTYRVITADLLAVLGVTQDDAPTSDVGSDVP